MTGRIAYPVVGRRLENKSKGLGNESLAFFFSGDEPLWQHGDRRATGLAVVPA